MKEYYGKSVKDFFETKGKQYLVKPAILRHLPKAGAGERLLDVGCGTGVHYEVASKKGYKYYGVDASEDMLKRAAEEHPKGGYIVAKGNRFAKIFKGKFDVVLISMLFPALDSLDEMTSILKECHKVLKSGKQLILVVANPAYDHYMQAGLLGRKNVQTNFKGYFESGICYKTQRHEDKKTFEYQDYHWTLTDYLNILKKAGFVMTDIDECAPAAEAKKFDSVFFEKRKQYPSFLLITAKPV